MKTWMLLSALAVWSAPAFANKACDKNCEEVVKQCVDGCKKQLKEPDKVPFCQSKCREFEGQCKKDCRDEDAKRRQ